VAEKVVNGVKTIMVNEPLRVSAFGRPPGPLMLRLAPPI
jgi:hypothetical protein